MIVPLSRDEKPEKGSLPTNAWLLATCSVAPTPWGTGGRAHASPLLQMAGHGGTVSRRTANKNLTKLYWPSRKRSPKRLIVLVEPKSEGSRPKKFFGALRLTGAPHFQIRSGATVSVDTL